MGITGGDSDLFLKNKGYELMFKFLGASIVQLAKKDNKRFITKRGRIGHRFNQSKKENQIYEIMGNLDRIPKKIEFYDLNDFDFEQRYGGKLINPEILIKEYIPGRPYCDEQLTTSEEQKMFNLVGDFHREGLAGLDLKRSNFVLTPDQKLFYIDFGISSRKGDKNSHGIEINQKKWDEFKMQDL